MKSLILNITRPGDADNTLLDPEIRYVAMCGNKPEVTFKIDCKQGAFFNYVKDLRYIDSDPSSSKKAITFFQNLSRTLFSDLKYLKMDGSDPDLLHIRLVTSPLEITQLPLEFVTAQGDLPDSQINMLVNPKRRVTLTREIRQESEARYKWPKQPRILFAWAQPSASVPYEEHKKALLAALAPLFKPVTDIPEPEANIIPFFTELPNASLKSIASEIQTGILEKCPYSHVHILAHGGSIPDMTGITFALLLCDKNNHEVINKVFGKDLSAAIVPDPDGDIPVTVTLSVCDSANNGTVMAPSGSLAHQLHRAGIPCVFASQFPLTQEGSVKLVQILYSELVKAHDPREALYKTRLELKKEDSHDWASLVAFARFPEDIDEQLRIIFLRTLFNSMTTTNLWVDHVLKFKDSIPVIKRESIFNSIEKRLDNSINELRELLTDSFDSTLETIALRSEHLGLLGSAYKRKAEFIFRVIDFNPQLATKMNEESKDALRAAKDFYQRAFKIDINNYWVAMQYLSLEALSGSSLENKNELWAFILYFAKWKEEQAKEGRVMMEQLWALGTLTELYLIKPLTVIPVLLPEECKSSLIIAKGYALQLKDSKNWDIIDSTKRQLERYISWWPELYPDTYRTELKEMALEIREVLL